jgi:hypothetical protein
VLKPQASVTFDASVCTPVCTNDAETATSGTVEALAAALQALSPAERARLAALLLGEKLEGQQRG